VGFTLVEFEYYLSLYSNTSILNHSVSTLFCRIQIVSNVRYNSVNAGNIGVFCWSVVNFVMFVTCPVVVLTDVLGNVL